LKVRSSEVAARYRRLTAAEPEPVELAPWSNGAAAAAASSSSDRERKTRRKAAGKVPERVRLVKRPPEPPPILVTSQITWPLRSPHKRRLSANRGVWQGRQPRDA